MIDWIHSLRPSALLTVFMVGFVLIGAAIWYSLIWMIENRWGRRIAITIAVHLVLIFAIDGMMQLSKWHRQSVDTPASAKTISQPYTHEPVFYGDVQQVDRSDETR